jgi:pimeloyl-ACP methyl ester carboxylesterase
MAAAAAAAVVLVLGTQEEQMRYADAGSVRIAYDDEGPRADDAVVFLGGWCNSGRSFFAPLAERLAARHRVIRLDWRGHGDSGRPAADFSHDELADDAMAVIQATGVRRVVPVSQAHGGWPALRLRRLLGNRVPRIILLSWMVLDPPPLFMVVFEMLDNPERWRQGLDNLLAGWLAGAPDEVAGWIRRETGSYGFDTWSRAARSQPTTASTAAPCGRLRNSTRNLTCCTFTPSRAPPGFSSASKSSRPPIRGFRPGG